MTTTTRSKTPATAASIKVARKLVAWARNAEHEAQGDEHASSYRFEQAAQWVAALPEASYQRLLTSLYLLTHKAPTAEWKQTISDTIAALRVERAMP